ncbi:hypothetical protein J7E62_01680, partial [Variovorax paradoxus]|nr:hypothetical protein [Variovorax paradoxus]
TKTVSFQPLELNFGELRAFDFRGPSFDKQTDKAKHLRIAAHCKCILGQHEPGSRGTMRRRPTQGRATKELRGAKVNRGVLGTERPSDDGR